MSDPVDQLGEQILDTLIPIKVDIMTIVLCALGILLVLIALDIFKNFLVGHLDAYLGRREEKEAERLLELKYDPSTSQFYSDVIDKKYRRLVNQRSQRKF